MVAITDNDTAGVLQFSAPALTVAEGAGTATLTVSRTGGNTGPLTVDVRRHGGTATDGVDFTLSTTQLTFNANQSSVPLVVTLIADADFEGNEVATFTLANPTLGATIGAKSTFTLTITDAQPTVFFAAPTFTVSESAASAPITVKRAGGVLTDTVQVNYATSAGTRRAGRGWDYTDVSGTLVFTANATSKTFIIPLLGDLVVDGATETVNLTLSAPLRREPGGQLGTPVDRGPEHHRERLRRSRGLRRPHLRHQGAAEHERSCPPSSTSRSSARAGWPRVPASCLNTVNGTATAGSDFTAIINKTVTFPAGKTS